eukprot:CAMPEP_0114692154 /NCGR_PEP_ID=MMETSP0191-20121206/67643_1 /TAXON_ID=126664 /ORGANISM="Sorites sp." /LENGTH=50 /DNA_ID=CAMNT_0001984251 /DNA_START=98 /DNA_END=247 /DNA_ORIENTATION=-
MKLQVTILVRVKDLKGFLVQHILVPLVQQDLRCSLLRIATELRRKASGCV